MSDITILYLFVCLQFLINVLLTWRVIRTERKLREAGIIDIPRCIWK